MKRSIFIGIATALALVVLTAGFAYATTGWDSPPGSGPAVTSQVRGGTVQPTGPGTGRGSCDQNAVRERTATRDNDCAGWADDHPYGGSQRVRATGSTPTTSARPSSQPRHDRNHHQAYRDGHDRCGC